MQMMRLLRLYAVLTSIQEDTIVIQKALSKDQIDEVITLSKEFSEPPPAESESSLLREY